MSTETYNARLRFMTKKQPKDHRLRCSKPRPRLWKTSLETYWDQDSSLENHNCAQGRINH